MSAGSIALPAAAGGEEPPGPCPRPPLGRRRRRPPPLPPVSATPVRLPPASSSSAVSSSSSFSSSSSSSSSSSCGRGAAKGSHRPRHGAALPPLPRCPSPWPVRARRGRGAAQRRQHHQPPAPADGCSGFAPSVTARPPASSAPRAGRPACLVSVLSGSPSLLASACLPACLPASSKAWPRQLQQVGPVPAAQARPHPQHPGAWPPLAGLLPRAASRRRHLPRRREHLEETRSAAGREGGREGERPGGGEPERAGRARSSPPARPPAALPLAEPGARSRRPRKAFLLPQRKRQSGSRTPGFSGRHRHWPAAPFGLRRSRLRALQGPAGAVVLKDSSGGRAGNCGLRARPRRLPPLPSAPGRCSVATVREGPGW
ncbi:uncharacterized protein LOC140702262 [Pogona vitticeps]